MKIRKARKVEKRLKARRKDYETISNDSRKGYRIPGSQNHHKNSMNIRGR